MLEATSIIWIIAAAVSAAILYSCYNTRIIGDFVRRLADSGACDSESAVNLTELGIGTLTRGIVALSTGKGSTLRRFIEIDEVGEGLEGRLKGGYYILPEKRETLLGRYNSKGTSLASAALCIVIVWVFAAVATAVLPFITSYLGDNGYIPDDSLESEITESIPKDDTSSDAEDSEKEDIGQSEGGSRYDTVA